MIGFDAVVEPPASAPDSSRRRKWQSNRSTEAISPGANPTTHASLDGKRAVRSFSLREVQLDAIAARIVEENLHLTRERNVLA